MTHTKKDIERAAQTAHEVNRAYCLGLGDTSQLPWDDAPKWQRDSAIDGVKAIVEDPSFTPEQSHERWMKHKRDEGWVYGETKSPEHKTHPCMVPYAELPLAQRTKDALFAVTVRGVLDIEPKLSAAERKRILRGATRV